MNASEIAANILEAEAWFNGLDPANNDALSQPNHDALQARAAVALARAVQSEHTVVDDILAILDEFRAWMWSEASRGNGARRWGVQHVLDHFDGPFSDAYRAALAAPVSKDGQPSGSDSTGSDRRETPAVSEDGQ